MAKTGYPKFREGISELTAFGNSHVWSIGHDAGLDTTQLAGFVAILAALNAFQLLVPPYKGETFA